LKTQQFCETSSTFELDNVKQKQFCRTSLNFEVIKDEASLSCFSEGDNIKSKAILPYMKFHDYSTSIRMAALAAEGSLTRPLAAPI